MNTVQKAQAWLVRPTEYGSEDYEIRVAYKIITALLAEREALLDALKAITKDGLDNTYTRIAQKAIQLCEESK